MTAPSSRNGKTRRNAPFPASVEAVATGRNDVFSHSSRGKCIAKDAEATREAREYAPPPTSALLNPHRECCTSLPNRPRFRSSLPFGRLPSCRRPTNLHENGRPRSVRLSLKCDGSGLTFPQPTSAGRFPVIAYLHANFDPQCGISKPPRQAAAYAGMLRRCSSKVLFSETDTEDLSITRRISLMSAAWSIGFDA
jgi:hypothetical protein